MGCKAGHVDSVWSNLKQRWFADEILDEVFEQRVKGFCAFDMTMQATKQRVNDFRAGMDHFAKAMRAHAEGVCSGLAYNDDIFLTSESCKLKQAMHRISHKGAPESHISVILRDMDFNLAQPIQKHIENNRAMRRKLEERRQKLVKMSTAQKIRHTPEGQKQYEAAVVEFHKLHAYIYEWFYIFEQFRGDILDSILQTLKHLQYEFFTTSAHAIGSVLPARLEFRPMVEMTPERLHAKVMVLLQAPVCSMSLTALKSQGFEDGPSRRALRLHQNDTQAAMDWLLEGGAGGAVDTAKVEDGVRAPVSLTLLKKLYALQRKQNQSEDSQDEPTEPQSGKSTQAQSQGTHVQGDGSADSSSVAHSESHSDDAQSTDEMPATQPSEATEETRQDTGDCSQTSSPLAASQTAATSPKANDGLLVLPPALHGPQLGPPPALAEGYQDVTQKCRQHMHVQSIHQGNMEIVNRELSKSMKALTDTKAEATRLAGEVQCLQSKLQSVAQETATLREQLLKTEKERDQARAAAEESECLAAEVAHLHALQAAKV